jgi:hypothetical protein
MNKNTVTKTSSIKTAPVGVHDTARVDFTIVKDTYDTNPINVNGSILEFKELLLQTAAEVKPNTAAGKASILGLIPCTYVEGANSKRRELITSRNMLVLDFDDMGTTPFSSIHQVLKNTVYFAWTTFSHVIKGNRFRVAIPFSKYVQANDWNQISANITAYNNRVFTGNLVVDPSCVTIGQIGYLPAINEAVGSTEFYFNDQTGTELFDPYSLPTVVLAQPTLTNETFTASTEQMAEIIAELKTVDAICNNQSRQDRMNWAGAVRAAGGSYSDFADLDQHIRLFDTKTTSAHCWKEAKSEHTGLIKKHLTRASRVKFGLVQPRIASVVNANIKPTNTTTIQLATGQKLADVCSLLNVTDFARSRIVSGTGTGKSYLVANSFKQKRIIVVPTKALADQFASDYNAVAYHGDTKRTAEVKTANFIAVTYASLPDLELAIGRDIFNYILFLDEVHTVVANYSYQEVQLRRFANRLSKYKTVVQLTATTVTNTHPDFSVDHVFEVHANSINTCYTELFTDNTTNSAINLTNDLESRGFQVAVYLNDTRDEGQLGKLSTALTTEELRVGILNSKTRGSDDFVKIVNEGDASDCPVTICTSVISEGVSITKHREHVAIIAMGFWTPEQLVQMSNRYRRAKSIHVYDIKRNRELVEVQAVDVEFERKRVEGFVKQLTNMLAIARDSEYEANPHSVMLLQYLLKFDDPNTPVCIDAAGNPYIDELKFSNMIYNRVAGRAAMNSEFMRDHLTMLLDQVGAVWTFNPPVYDTNTEICAEVRAAMDVGHINAVAVRKQNEQQVLDIIATENANENWYKLDDAEKGQYVMNKTEEKMRRIVNVVADVTGVDAHDNLSKVVEYVRQHSVTSQQATRYENIMKVNKAIETAGELHKEYNNMLNNFKIGEWYSTEQVETIMQDCWARYKHVFAGSTKKRTMYLNTVFDTESKKKSINGVKIDGYVILSRAMLPQLK